jgi:hypothetical protein
MATTNTDQQRKRPYLWDKGISARPIGFDRAVVVSSGIATGGGAKRSPEIHVDQPRSFTGGKPRGKRGLRLASQADQMRLTIARLAGTPLPATGAASKPATAGKGKRKK